MDRNEGKKFLGKELKRRKKRCGFFFLRSSLFLSSHSFSFCRRRYSLFLDDVDVYIYMQKVQRSHRNLIIVYNLKGIISCGLNELLLFNAILICS